MTSAHCIYCDATQFNCPAYVYAYLGYESGDAIANDTGKPYARRYISRELYEYPDFWYGSDIGRYDLALIRLTKSIDFGDRQLVNSVCMPEANIHENGDELAMTSGWGPISSNGTNPDTGHIMGFMRIVMDSTLYREPNWTEFEYMSVLPTKRYHEQGTDICVGDSGGPLVQYVNGRAVLLGVFSGFNKDIDGECGYNNPDLNTYWARDTKTLWYTTRPYPSSCMLNTWFVWVPCIVLWLGFILNLIQWICRTSNKYTVIKWNYYNISRLGLTVVSTGILLVELILSLCRKYQWSDSPSTAYIIAIAVQIITRLALCIVFYLYILSGITTNGFVWIYLLADTVLGALSVATYATQDYLQNYEFILYCINYSITVLLLIYCTFADKQLSADCNKIDAFGKHTVCPKQWASFPSQITYHWANSMFWKGWQKSLIFDDLWSLRPTDNINAPQWHGYIFTVLLMSINVLASLFNAYYSQNISSIALNIKSGLQSAVYRKSMVLSNESKRHTPNGEIMNLMAIDCQQVNDNFQNIGYILSAPLQIAIAIYLLYTELGVAALIGVSVFAIILPIDLLVIIAFTNYQIKTLQQTDSRLAILNEIITGIKVLKLYAWEQSFMERVTKIRQKELLFLKNGFHCVSIFVIMLLTSPSFAQLISFGSYIGLNISGGQLTPEILFVSISLFSLIKDAVIMLPVSFYTLSMKNSNTLNKIDLNVTDGQFVAIIGGVGSGKSSLISALFGDMNLIQGSVNIRQDVSVAYVPQQAWIQNTTVKQNILFDKQLDSKLYDRVIDNCALGQDLQQLPAGDQTEIGEKGVNLSGGQKQRVSLARAVYSGADLYLLDDPLSAVDSHVGKHIVTNVLDSRTGILRNKTRILVTNQLFVLPDVDSIVVLKDGSVVAVGTYEQLLRENKYFMQLIKQYLSDTNNTDITDDDDNDSDYNLPEICRKIYLRYILSIGSLFFIIYMTTLLLTTACVYGSTFWLNYWSNSMMAAKYLSVNNGYYLGIFGAIIAGQLLTLVLSRYFLVVGTVRASNVLHGQLLTRILHAPMSFFDTTPGGRIANRFNKDMNIVDQNMPTYFNQTFEYIFNVLAILLSISIQTPIFLAPFIVIAILYYVLQFVYIKTSRQLKRLESITRSPIYSHFGETLTGVSSIRAYDCVDRFLRESDHLIDINQMCLYPNIVANSWLKVRLPVLSNFLIFFASLFGVLAKGRLSGADLGLSLSNAISLTTIMETFITSFSLTENYMVSVERIREYCCLPSEADWHSGYPLPDNWPDRGCVRFDGYGTRYREGLDLVLNNVYVDIRPGEKIGIVGRTGAGKSSLTLALFRLIEPAMGRIVIDDTDIGQLGLQQLRSRLTIIPQEPVLFSGTIRFNLDPFDRFTDDQLWSVLEHSHLNEFVKSTDMGLDYQVDESGDNLSVGQRQLICLARALLRNTRLLILDEATAAVDVETDALIQQTIRQEFKSCTVLTIAHRINTIMDSDRVLVLNDGRVAEFASPDELLSNRTSIFYLLAKDAGVI
ncbi:ATP-binding cassette sub-family C member 2-like [Oppia nitens]|uniref:ATP-binding cassette sub-family C member 2-like n=1 Tax=Oppia nitens TaxID=1686743 RepID=UPI0023DC4BFD|nr:ATP-binding cassette sub-family C member 2-like [Oppia nitens]